METGLEKDRLDTKAGRISEEAGASTTVCI